MCSPTTSLPSWSIDILVKSIAHELLCASCESPSSCFSELLFFESDFRGIEHHGRGVFRSSSPSTLHFLSAFKVSYGRMKALLDLISPQFFRCIPSSMLLKAFQFERSFLATVVAYRLPPMAAMHTILALQYGAYPTQDPAE
eukprot:EG_transcript_23220